MTWAIAGGETNGISAQRALLVARRAFWRQAQSLEGDPPPILEVRPVFVPGAEGPLTARLYTPYAAGPRGPGLIFFHGGGFVLGDLDSHDMICRRLAHAARIRVLSVGYRLAPAHKFPAAPDDCLASTLWALEQGEAFGLDPSRLAVGGDSAGGNLAAVVTQDLKRRGAPKLAAQLLIYPCVQFLSMRPSRLALEQAYVATQAAQDFVRDLYLPDPALARDLRVSPLMAESFTGLPPALIVTAGLDPLLDEGRAYAAKLAAFGVDVRHAHYANQPHGFFNLTAFSRAARDAVAETGRTLSALLG